MTCRFWRFWGHIPAIYFSATFYPFMRIIIFFSSPLVIYTYLCLYWMMNFEYSQPLCAWTDVCIWSNRAHSLFILLAAPASCTLQNLNNKAIHTRAGWLHEVIGWVELPSTPLGQLSYWNRTHETTWWLSKSFNWKCKNKQYRQKERWRRQVNKIMLLASR